jgi:hypothetical protein
MLTMALRILLMVEEGVLEKLTSFWTNEDYL